MNEPSALWVTVPLAGPVTTDVVSASPSTSLSFARTLTTTGVSSLVVAASLPAVGAVPARVTAAAARVRFMGADDCMVDVSAGA